MGLSRAPPFLRRKVRVLSQDVPYTWVMALCLALAGRSCYAFAGGHPISNIAFNGHDWWPTLRVLLGPLLLLAVVLRLAW
jgi:hypothetical protein